MKGKVKANTVDRYLHSIRLQIIELIEPGVNVVEFGCGNGDLLFKLSGRINRGMGIDISQKLIDYAKQRQEKDKIENLEFKSIDLLNGSFSDFESKYGIASLLLHCLPWNKSVSLLDKIILASNTTIICGFSKPENWRQKVLLWMDQRFSGHFSHFRNYANNGFTEGMLNAIDNIEYTVIDTFDPVIKIYKVVRIYN